jgi:hypothetical protein
MKYAWIENNKVRDVCQGNPDECYHPDVAVFYNTQVPDDAVNGDGWVNGQLIKPEPVIPKPIPKTIDSAQVRTRLTFSEKTKWDNDGTPEIVTAKLEFAEPRTVEDATEVLQFLVDSGSISQASMDKILAE